MNTLGTRFSELLSLVTVPTPELQETRKGHKTHFLEPFSLLGTEVPPRFLGNPRLESVLASSGSDEVPNIIARRERIVETRTLVLGPDNPYTIWVKTSLAWTEYYAGSLFDPFDTFTELWDTRRRLKGSQDRDTLVASVAVGWATSLRKRYGEASRILQDAGRKLERVCGSTNFETLYCRVARAQAELEMSKLYSSEIEAPGDDNDPEVLARCSRLTELRDEKGNLGIELLESVIPHLPPGEPERAEVECMVYGGVGIFLDGRFREGRNDWGASTHCTAR